MPLGIMLQRSLVFVLKNGAIVLDWGDGAAIDLLENEFLRFDERDYSHAVSDEELEFLKHAGRVASYDSRTVYVHSLPEPPQKSL